MKVFVGKCLVLLLLLWSSLALAADGDKFIFLSSTIGPIDSGIVSALEDQFEKETGIRVRHVGAGTGAALNIAQQGSDRSGDGSRQIARRKIYCRWFRHRKNSSDV